MSTTAKREARLSVRLPVDLKRVIEEAAAQTGRSVSDFAVATLVETARSVLQQQSVTELTNRDRDRFMALLDDVDARPNKALTDAARKYKRRMG